MPRPPRAIGITSRLYIRLTTDEKTLIGSQANKAGLTLSEYIRRCGLHKRIRSRVSEKAMGELGRLGGLQKVCMKQLKDIPSSQDIRGQLNAVLSAILTEIERIKRIEDE
jgi:hypothetical protein